MGEVHIHKEHWYFFEAVFGHIAPAGQTWKIKFGAIGLRFSIKLSSVSTLKKIALKKPIAIDFEKKRNMPRNDSFSPIFPDFSRFSNTGKNLNRSHAHQSPGVGPCLCVCEHHRCMCSWGAPWLAATPVSDSVHASACRLEAKIGLLCVTMYWSCRQFFQRWLACELWKCLGV